jgi:hypothetical protein
VKRLTGSVLFTAAVLFLSPAALSAQVTQVIDFPAGQITGAWAAGGCATGNERGSSTIGAAMTMTWTDTTGAPNSSVVQIQIEANWKFWCSGGGYTVAVNGTDMGAGTTPSNTNNCVCNASPFGSTTQVIGPGSFTWNSNGSNTVSWTISATAWIGIMDNSQSPNWAARITVTMLNQGPDDPTNLGQIGSDGKGIGVAGVSFGGSLTLRATVADPDFDDCFLEAEFHPTSVFFPGTPNYVGAAAPSGTYATISLTGVPDGAYHWRVRSVDEFDVQSAWVSFGANSEAVADVVVNSTFEPPAPLSTEDHGAGDCDLAASAAGVSWPSAVAGLALIAFGLVRRRR